MVARASPAEIGATVRAIRRRRGLKLEVAAELAGISKSYLAMLERGERRFDRRGLIEDLAATLGCSPAELTGQPYPAIDRAGAEALAALNQVNVALYDCTLSDVPDLPVRPVAELADLAHAANLQTDESRYGIAASGLGPVLTELHVHAVTNSDHGQQRAALMALVEACFAACGCARQLGRTELAVQAAQRGEQVAGMLDNPSVRAFTAMTHGGALIRLGARRRAASMLASGLSTVEPLALRHLDTADRIAPQRLRNDPIARELLGELDMRARRRVWELDSLKRRFGLARSA